MVFCNLIKEINKNDNKRSHNPYFNRWFSAIDTLFVCEANSKTVTILILIDGFLQLQVYKPFG